MMGKTFSLKMKVLLLLGIFIVSMIPVTVQASTPYEITSVFVKRTDGTVVSHRGTSYNPNNLNLRKGDPWTIAVTVKFLESRYNQKICMHAAISDNYSNDYNAGSYVYYWTEIIEHTGKSAGQSYTYWLTYDATMINFWGHHKAMGEGQWKIHAVYVGDSTGGSCDTYPGANYAIVSGSHYAISQARFEVWNNVQSGYDRTYHVLHMVDYDSMPISTLNTELALTNYDFLNEDSMLNIRFIHQFAPLNWISKSWAENNPSQCLDVLNVVVGRSDDIMGNEWDTSFKVYERNDDVNLYKNQGFDILFATFNYNLNEGLGQGCARYVPERGGMLGYATTGVQGTDNFDFDITIKHEFGHLFGATHLTYGTSIMNSADALKGVTHFSDYDLHYEMWNYRSDWDSNYDDY